ncbi:MAG TPA: sodium:proton antiporter [Lachnospiraceae bacterium]|nr:sodium:proton antiporter [Lachnospiraceae bacterium]
MNFIWNFPLFTVVLSLFSGPLCMMLKAKAARNYTIAYESVLTAMNACVLGYTLKTGSSFTYPMGEFPAPWGNEIRAGSLEALIALLFSVVLLCSVTAGYHFIRKDMDESKINLYFSVLNLMTAALMAMAWTNDVFTGYVFLEIMTLTSCGILIVREIGRTTLAAVRYMILNLMGSGLFLMGIVLLYDISGHLLMIPMRESLTEIVRDPAAVPAISMAIGIMTIGISIKSGLFPFYFWMPDTYGWATPTSGAVLSALVSKSYIFLLFKIYYRAIGIHVIEKTPIFQILFVLGICGMVVGSISAMHASTVNRMIAFSSAAQIGYIYMGIGLGTVAGFAAAMFQILAHALTKSLLFLTAPYLAEVSGDSLKFHALQGSARRDPLAGTLFSVGALSMVGIPVFAGFSAKLMFGQAAVLGGIHWRILTVLAALGVSSLLNALYFIRTLIRIYSDPDQSMKEPARKRPILDKSRIGFFLAGEVLTLLNVFLGLFSWMISDVIYKGLGMFL